MDTSNTTLDAGYGNSSLNLSALDLEYLSKAGKWGRGLAIFFLVMMALALLGSLAVLAISAGSWPGTSSTALFSEAFVGLAYLVLLGLYVYPIFQLYRFSSKILSAVRTKNSTAATAAFKALKRMFQFLGIATIAFILFYVIGIGAFFSLGSF